MLVFRARPRKSPTADAALTNSERRIMRYLNDAMNAVRNEVARREGEFLDAVTHLSANRVANMVPVDPWFDAAEQIRDELLAELTAAGQRVKLPSMQKATVSFRFDATRPEAARWAEKEAGNLIREVTQEQVNVVREYAARSAMGETTPRQVARGLRDVIGLTAQQAGWVENFRNKQISERMAAGQTFDQAYEASERATQRYHDRIHKYRAETIARTEILRASNEGRNQSWQQGVDEGFIQPDEYVKEWSTEIDGRQCSICGPLNETQVGFNDTFPNGDPPIHPNCRCDVLLVPIQVEDDISRMSDDEVDAYIDQLISGNVEQKPVTGPAELEDYLNNATELAALVPGRESAAGQPGVARDSNGDQLLAQIYENRGYNTQPRIVTQAEMDEILAQDPTRPELYRGVTDPAFADQYRTGTHFPGRGVSGNGTYTSNIQATGTEYAGKDGAVMRMTLDPSAKIIQPEQVKELSREASARAYEKYKTELEALNEDDPEYRTKFRALGDWYKDAEKVIGDPGRLAAVNGYDAIELGWEGDPEVYYIILNRGRVIVQETNVQA